MMIGNIFGVFLFSMMTVSRVTQALDGSWIAILLTLQSGIAIVLYFRRSEPEESMGWAGQAFAWFSALLPMAFSPGMSHNLILVLAPVLGLLLALWAMVALDRSFSVAPAKRELVTWGPYVFMRHPMYGGEILSLIGVLVASFSLWNAGVFLLFITTVVWRVKQEDKLLGRSY
jgi:protein-S-isoprenylcysteine O-methyltransferase Ste14